MQNILSRKTFDSARCIAAIWVFMCHCFYPVHMYFGFFSVAVFFFISGYGMEVTSARERALTRLPRFLAVFGFFSVIYYVFWNEWFYPTAWYLLTYALVMVIYYFFGKRLAVFVPVFLAFLVLLRVCGFEYNYWLCPFGFLYGVIVYRHGLLSWFSSVLLFVLAPVTYYFQQPFLIVLAYPLFLRLFVTVAQYIPLSRFAFIVFPFFSLHCWFLALFDATWTLGGDTSLFGSVCAFCLSLVGAWLLYLYVPIFSKKKFFIFQ